VDLIGIVNFPLRFKNRNMTPQKSQPQAKDVPKDPAESTEVEPAATKEDVPRRSVSTPGSEGFILGLSRSEQKRAAKKAKEKKIAEERKKETQRKKEERKRIDQQNKTLQLIRKYFMKNQDLDTSTEVEEVFVFEDASSSGSPRAPECS
jgi:hypothetical protein